MIIRYFSKVSIYSRSFYIILLLAFSFNGFSQYQSLCWRISGDGLSQPSYLYGTMHVADSRVFHFGDKTMAAFAASKAYAMEVDPEKAMSMNTLLKMMMTDGTTISKLIPDSDYHYLDSLVTAATGSGMEMYNAMEPIIISSILEEMDMGISSTDTSNMPEFMDLYFYKKAQEEKKKVIGIETIDEQIGVLHTMSYKEQADMLVQSIEDIKSNTHTGDKDLMKYYIAQDLDSILANSDETQMPPNFYKALVTDRNIRMADRIAVFIHKQPTFIGVGALHLPGPGGVIALLRKKGYKVEEWK